MGESAAGQETESQTDGKERQGQDEEEEEGYRLVNQKHPCLFQRTKSVNFLPLLQ